MTPWRAVHKEARDVPEDLRERLRAALLDARREGRNVTVRWLREAAAPCDTVRAGLVLRLYRDGKMPPLEQPWTDAPPAAQAPEARAAADPGDELEALAGAVAAATTPRAISEVAGQVAALVARGQVAPAVGRVLRDLLAERRRGVAEARAVEPPPEDPTAHALVTRDALDVARAVDYIISDERRARVVALVAAELRADLIETAHNPDTAGVGR